MRKLMIFSRLTSFLLLVLQKFLMSHSRNETCSKRELLLDRGIQKPLT
jgi:hypothetical protein